MITKKSIKIYEKQIAFLRRESEAIRSRDLTDYIAPIHQDSQVKHNHQVRSFCNVFGENRSNAHVETILSSSGLTLPI